MDNQWDPVITDLEMLEDDEPSLFMQIVLATLIVIVFFTPFYLFGD